MFSHEGIGVFMMWHFANNLDSDILDTDTLEPNLAGDAYLR